MERSIQVILSYQMYHVALIGVDACGFNGNTDEGESPLSSSRSSLTRVQLQNSATDGCSSLPSRPSSVITTYSGLSRRSRMCGTAWQRRRGSRSRRGTSCSLLGRHSSPLLTSMVLPSSTREPHSSCRRGGTDAIDRSLFFVYPNDASLLAVSSQYLVGDSILVTPVLTPNVTTVTGLFPEGRTTIWRDWFTHKVRSLALRSV
jgi:alpha-glucosidase